MTVNPYVLGVLIGCSAFCVWFAVVWAVYAIVTKRRRQDFDEAAHFISDRWAESTANRIDKTMRAICERDDSFYGRER